MPPQVPHAPVLASQVPPVPAHIDLSAMQMRVPLQQPFAQPLPGQQGSPGAPQCAQVPLPPPEQARVAP